ncbi:hypothetical protein KKH18_09855 [bacterium]|nr:hypothetical protein [bacterium]
MEKYQAMDLQLAQVADTCTESIPVLSSVGLEKARLASALGEEIADLLSFALNEWKELMEELDSPIAITERHEMLIGYYHLMQSGDISDPIMQRARIISQFYFDLVYFRDAVFMMIRKRISNVQDHKTRFKNLIEWLQLFGDSEYWERLRALRNGFAHGRWSFMPDYSGIICYPEMKPPYTPHLWIQNDLRIAHSLLYCLQCVFFEEAKQAITSQNT